MRHSQHIKTGLAVTLALGAISAPAASAHGGQAGWVVRPNPDQQAAQLARAAATRPAQNTWVVRPNPDEQYQLPAPTTIVRVTDPNGGFDWGDAGIGAAGTTRAHPRRNRRHAAARAASKRPAHPTRRPDSQLTQPSGQHAHRNTTAPDPSGRAQSLTPTVPTTGPQSRDPRHRPMLA